MISGGIAKSISKLVIELYPWPILSRGVVLSYPERCITFPIPRARLSPLSKILFLSMLPEPCPGFSRPAIKTKILDIARRIEFNSWGFVNMFRSRC